VIAPTTRIAGLCHSVLRGEPYSTCELGCTYCYARWYRGPHGEPRPLRLLPRLIRALARAQEDAGVLLPVRMATLSDPFQPAEARYRVALDGLREAARRGVPVVLNTRLPPPTRRHWRVLRDLAGRGLLLAQVTVTGPQEAWPRLRRLEPGSPSPGERLALASALASLGAPVVVRLQPLIPGVGDLLLEEQVARARAAGARGLILEFLRAEPQLARQLGGEWDPYAAPVEGEVPVVHPRLEYRLRVAARIASLAAGEGLAFQTCKEGLFHLHHPRGMDCCGYTLLAPGVARRPHLADVYRAALETPRGLPFGAEALERACRGRESLLCRDRLEALPRWLRRPLRAHEARLEKILSRPDLLEKLSPSLRVIDDRIIAWPPAL